MPKFVDNYFASRLKKKGWKIKAPKRSPMWAAASVTAGSGLLGYAIYRLAETTDRAQFHGLMGSLLPLLKDVMAGREPGPPAPQASVGRVGSPCSMPPQRGKLYIKRFVTLQGEFLGWHVVLPSGMQSFLSPNEVTQLREEIARIDEEAVDPEPAPPEPPPAEG